MYAKALRRLLLSSFPPSLPSSHTTCPLISPCVFLPASTSNKILYPKVPIEAVVSFGTGNVLESQPVEGFGWAPIFNQLINSATNTEAVHDSLADFLPQDRYYRFNPNIENMSIDEIRPEKLAYLKVKAKEYFLDPRNSERLDQLVKLLSPPKGSLRAFSSSPSSPPLSSSSSSSSSPSSSSASSSSYSPSAPTTNTKVSKKAAAAAAASSKALSPPPPPPSSRTRPPSPRRATV
ncbi:hypothetical protein VYU27_006205 [Nannochloropsis oceanica]